MNQKSNYKRGFTLIEILGVLVVLSILALIAIPQVGRMISSARVEAAKSSVRNFVVGANAQASMSLVSKDGIDVTNTKFVFETGVDDAELSKIEINGDVPSYAYLKYDVVAKSVAYGIFCSKGYSFEYDNGIIKETEENYCNQTYDRNSITITEIVSGTNSIKVKYTVADPALVASTKCYYSQNKTYALEGAVYNNECNIEGLKHNTTYQFKICITDTENKEECEASYVTTLKMSNPTITYINTPNTPVNGYLKSQTLKVKYYSEFIENPQYFVRSPKTSTISTSTIQSCGTGELPGTCITDVVTTLEAGKWYKVPGDVDVTFAGNSTESGYLMAATYDGFNYAAAARAIVSKTDNENPIIEIGYPSKTTNTLKVPFNVSDSKSGIATYTCKYSDVSGSYSIDGSIQNMICTLSNLQSNKTYYYQICATDKLGNSDCKTGSAKTVNIVNPTITVTSTPEIPVNGYYRSQDFTIIYSRQNMTNPTFYVRATRTATTLPLMILERCNSGGTLNINSCSTINTTTVSSGYWYKVKETFRLIYNAYANSEASIKAVTYDGNNLSGAATIPVAKIDTKAPTVTLGTVTQTTNSVVINYTLTDNESGIDSYTCRYSDTLNKYTTNGSSITDTSCTLTNLKNNTTYYYQICATDKLGNTSNDSCVTDSIKTDNIVTPTISITNTPTVSQNDYLTKQEVTITYNGTGTTNPLYYFKTTRNAKLKTGTIQKACGTETVPGECVNTNNDIAADTWYKVAGNVTLTYDESADVEASLIAVTYDGTNYSNSVSVVLSKIDLEKPVINIINAVPTSNSIELTYEISDAKSGIDTYTCEYSTAYNGTYSPITNATLYGCKLTSSLAKNTTYYYRICATDKLGFSECAVGSRVTLDVNKPTISYTNTPNEPGNGYLKNQVATINYAGGTDFQYFVKTTRKASIPSTTVNSCGTGGGPSRCGSESTVTELSANTWYKVPSNISLTYNETNSTDAYIYAINTDGRNQSDMLTGMVAKIDTLDPTITNFTATSTTNSLTINYTLNDANSGIAYYTCKYGTSNNNYANTVEATNSSCVLNNLDNANTYYYQICVYDNVGNYTCDTGNKKPNIVNSPVFVFTNDPISPVADYLKSQKVEIKFDATNINNPEYYIKSTKNGVSNIATSYVCGSDTTQSNCVTSNNTNIEAGKWYRVPGDIEITYTDTNTNNNNIYAVTYDGNNYSTSASTSLSKIDVTNPTINITSTTSNSTSITINYTLTDNESGINTTECKYSDTVNSYINEGTASNNRCVIAGLDSSKTYYYEICTYDKVNNKTCAQDSYTAKSIINPIITFTNTPSEAANNYFKEQVANITFSNEGVADATYYIKTTRKGNVSSMTANTCGTGTLPGSCSSNTNVTELTANTWYKVPGNTNVTYNETNTSEAYIYAVTYDGNKYSGTVTSVIAKIDRNLPVVTIDSTLSTTNSITINYTLSDTHSGIDTYTCKYGEVSGTYNKDATNVTASTCEIKNLTKGKTYYYQVCAVDRVGNNAACEIGSIVTNTPNTPVCTPYNTPTNSVDGYLKSQKMTCTFNTANITNPTYYIKTMRDARSLTNVLATCGTDTTPGTCSNASTKSLSANTWYKVAGEIDVIYDETNTSESIIYAMIYDETNYTSSTTNVAKIDTTEPLLGLSTPIITTNSIEIPLTMSDAHSGIASYTCKYSDTANTYTNDAFNITESKCMLNWLTSGKTYYYKICVIDKVGTETCKTGAANTRTIAKPTISITNTPSDTPNNDTDNYVRNSVASITYSNSGTTTVDYYVKSTRDAKLNVSTTSSCGTETMPGACIADTTTNIVANTWYRVPSNVSITYDVTDTSTATLYATAHDGDNFIPDSTVSVIIPKVDKASPELTIDKTTVNTFTNSAIITYSISDIHSGINSYTCKYSTTNSNYQYNASIMTVTNNTCTISNLEDDKTYYYQVCATDKVGNDTTCDTGNINTKPVTNPTVTYTNNIQVTKETEANSTHKGIVYLNPKSPTTACTESSTLTNTNTGCKKFYIYDDSGDTYKMIMDRNMSSGTVAWINETDYTSAGGTSSDWTNKLYNKFGPITAVKTLYSDTSGWIGNPRLITADEVAHIVGADDADEAIGWSSTKTYKNSTSADPITEIYGYYLDGSGTTYSDSNGWNKKTATTASSSNYGWLFDYTYQCTSNGCNIADGNTYNGNNIRGYWTATANSNINGAWYIGSSGMVASITANTSNGAGIRPVIEIAKEVIDNSYLKSQVAKVTFTSTNITNPRYFIKTTKASTVAANKVTYACGTETLPDITNCSSSSVTTLDTNTWYEVTSTLNVTYNTSNANAGNLYAVTYDGINFSGSVEVPIAKIDSVAPTITKSGSLSVTTNSITRDYTITENESGIAYITCKYGYASGSYTNVVDSSNVTTTSCTIPNLKSNTRYYYQVIVTDKAGNDSTAITGYNTTTAITNPSVAYTNNPYIIKVNAASTDTHFGIIYMDPSNLTNECNSSSTLTITNTGCKKFYIYDESGDTYKMIMDRNLGDNVRWITKADYLTAGGTEAEWGTGNTSKGPLTAMEQLNNDTTGWIGNPRMITADEIAAIVGADTAVNWSSSNPYGTDVNSQTSWIYLDGSGTTYSSEDGWQKQVATSKGASNYAWLFDYTHGCRIYGCNTRINGVYGYWTSSKIVNSNNVWLLNRQGRFYNSNDVTGKITSNDYGVRPVITLPKDLVNGNYINNQTLTVTYDNTSMTNPRYFVKTTKDTSIASGQVIGSCGTNTLPNPNCNSASVTTLLSDTWYEVNNPANVTNSIIDDSYANLYAVTYDGTNFSGSVEVPMSKIDNTIPADFTITLSNRSTNSITLTYSLTDNDSGIFNEGTTCKYSDTLNSYIYDASTVTSSSCLIQGLIKDKIYYYQVCAYDKAGNKRCKTGSTETLTPVNPTITYTVNPLVPTVITAGENDKHLGIVYMDPANPNTTCTSTDTLTTGVTGCKKFYIYDYDSSSQKYKLIMDRNLGENVLGIDMDSYLGVGGTLANWNNLNRNNKGFVKAINELANRTTNWIGNPRMITADEIAHIVGADEDIDWNSANPWGTNVGTQSSWFYLNGSGNSYSSSNGWQKSSSDTSYAWLYNYLANCTNYSCTDPLPGSTGYWVNNIRTGHIRGAWLVSNVGKLETYNIDSTLIGIRPVLEIPASMITGSYLKSQVSSVTFTNSNIASPRYFVKSTSTASIPSGKVIASCGTDTLPIISSCTSSNVTTMVASTWYEVNNNVSVTHNTTNNSAAQLLAVTSDGLNFTGSVGVPVGKIDATNPSTPTVTYTTGSNTSNWQNNVSITLSSTDNVAVWYYEADTNNDGNADFTINTVYEPKNVNYSTIRYRAVDTVGNRSDWTSNYTLKVDATTPTITINSSIPDFIKQGDSYQVLGTYTGGASVNTPTCNYSNTTSLQPGEYTLSCTVTSASGNSATATKKLLVIYPIYSARESNQTLFTINGRNYIKPNASHAIAGMFYIDSSNYLGPIMVSTDSAAVRYTTSGDSNTDNTYITTYSYKGITWYISANNAFVSNGSTNYHRRATDVTVPLIAATTFNEANTNATMQAAAKKLIDNALSGEYVEFGACTFTEQVFEYTGGAVNFTVPCEGTYILEVWGAQGGGQGSSGGKGGYSRGYQTLAEDQELTIVVGGAGTLTGGYNGGGNGTGTDYYGGGGATHIAKKNNSYTTLESYGNATTANNYLYIVAGGGGGAATYQSIPHSGAGGGDTIRPNQEWSGYSGFGKGANANYTQNDFGGAGGGGGYYGGRSDHNANAPGGGGGISYLDGVFNNYNEIGVRESNGKAKITFVPDFSPEDGINFSYTGTIQKYIIPETGMYYVEAWGAEGGNSEYAGGKGGYSYGYRHFDQGDVIYIGVGGKGTNNYSISDVPGGFNGGGTGKSAAAGGGATHMAFVDGTLNTIGYTSFVTNENGIIAAGGGGGSGRLRDWTGTEWVDSTYHLYPAYRDLYGGDGGGVNGSSGTGIYGNSTASALEIAVGHGGTPTSGGIGDRDNHATGDGSFGLGGTPGSAGAGGGGGLYGGGSGSAYNSKTPGGGGSGYFVALTSGNTETGVREGDGHAKVTKVPEYEFESMDFLYSGLVQKFIIPKTGTYLLETWGGAGGKSSDGNISGGKGAYAYGFKSFTAGDVIYIAVGGKGNDSLNQSSVTIPGGFNGGGNGRTTSSSDYTGGGGGGGATHIGLSNALLKDTTVGNLLLVAGGGGGAALAAGGDGGNVGADVNVSGTGVSCTGGTKTSAGTSSLTGAAYTAASYGVGGSAAGGSEMGGGGSGLYGGAYGRGGCGGSSYTASSLLNATIEDGINTLEGHAKITFITSDAISTNFYMATGNCTRGTYQRGTCHFDNNQTECGCGEYNECQDESCGLYCTSSSICGTGYSTCTNSTCCGNEIGTCATEACGCAARNSCANGSACGWTCDDYTWTRNGSKCIKTTSYYTTYNGIIEGCHNNTFREGQYSCNAGDRMWACRQSDTLGTTIWCEHTTVKNAKAKSCVNDSCSCATYNTCQSADCPAGAAKTCSNACCGTIQAKTCRNDEACIGVEGAHYGTCQNSNCTCKTANSCNKSDLVYYTCPNGGTLRGSICITS